MLKWADYEKKMAALSQEEIRELEIVAQIISRRKSLGITQKELADKAGLKQSAIARLENITVTPRLNTLNKVCEALGLKVTLELEEESSAAIELAIRH